MFKYNSQSLKDIKLLNKNINEALIVIGQLDGCCEKLCEVQDKRILNINSSRGKHNSEITNEVCLLGHALEKISNKKLQMATQSYDVIDQRLKLIDCELNILEQVLKKRGVSTDAMVGRKRKEINETVAGPSNEKSSAMLNEPLYCTCQQVAFGEMIACDNENCSIEWYHYACVNLVNKPKNKWICPQCVPILRKKKRNKT